MAPSQVEADPSGKHVQYLRYCPYLLGTHPHLPVPRQVPTYLLLRQVHGRAGLTGWNRQERAAITLARVPHTIDEHHLTSACLNEIYQLINRN